MAADYTIDVQNRTIRIVFSGLVTVEEMYQGRRRMKADAMFDRTFSQLADARLAKSFEMNGYSVKQFAQEHVLTGNARRAIVTSTDPDAGLARMFQIYRELAGGKETIEIFNDIDKAIQWLGLPASYRGM